MKKAWIIYLEHDFDMDVLHIFEGADNDLFLHAHKLQDEVGDLKIISTDNERRIVKWQVVGSGTILVAQEKGIRK